MEDTFRCLFELEDGSFCWEAVAAAGQHCARHIRVVDVPAIVIPAIVPRHADEHRCVAIKANGERCTARRRGATDRCGTHKDWQPIRQCASHVGPAAAGIRCTKNARRGFTMCGTHKNREPEAPGVAPAPAPPQGLVCRVIIKSSRRRGEECGRQTNLRRINAGPGAQPEFCCAHHHGSRAQDLRNQYLQLDFESIRTVHAEIALPADPAIDNHIIAQIYLSLWRVPITVYSTDPAQARAESMRRARLAIEIWANDVLRRPVALPLREGLAGFAHDRQNVHTAAANKLVANANKELEKADAIDGSLSQIKKRFTERGFGTPELRKSVHKDMKRWYSDPQVMAAIGQMEANDFGYKRLLDKVWGLIQKSKHKDDLEQRLWEEAVDSLGMCTQGHMTRLANVLQGFEESAEAPTVEIPKGERLQMAMAQIAELPIGEREAAARRVFAELEVAEGEQGAWMEALEVA